MSNFQFLHKEWPDIFAIAKEAEELSNVKARSSLVNSRAALEKGVRWMCVNDSRLTPEYNERETVYRIFNIELL